MSEISLTMLEIGIGILVEGVMLGLIFQGIASKETKKQQENLKNEMQNLQKQLRQDFDQSQRNMMLIRNDILNQVKESKTKN